ncbi:MAG: phage GP46 family protein [Methylobacterium sp.]|nr:phage GP46 family protein [Methylobacterium sp.]MCA3600165.1 phage GP46 family protein [Methylobacterium sp.]MCA3607720.1 phage GP46 family protein [Methylobacterium sp.]MCA3628451.1 phage GP46 family protein [Methylobacterium sp.]MCA4923966.1 phage GP46 family protein [Methylobacterium sp.]
MTYAILPPAPARSPSLFWSSFWNGTEGLADWRVVPLGQADNPGGLDSREALASAVIISLFTDRRAPEGWRPEVTDRRGYWGDGVAEEGAQPRALGSHLWLLRNEVATEENAALARLYAIEALAWMTEEAVVARVDASAGLIENPRRGVWLRIDLYARDGSRVFAEKYERFWQEMR